LIPFDVEELKLFESLDFIHYDEKLFDWDVA
jgi:hypothetical protein